MLFVEQWDLRFDTSAVGSEVKEQFLGRDAIVEGGGVLEILVIGLVNTVTDEFGRTFLGGNVRIVILEEESVGGLHTDTYDRGRIVVRLYAISLGGRTNARPHVTV